MNAELFDRVAKYRAVMSMIKSMLDQGIITEQEYNEIDRKTAQDYGLSLSVIFR